MSPPWPLSPQTSFFLVREDTKAAVLLHLLRTVVRPQDQTVVFVATKHHAEYLSEVGGWGNQHWATLLGTTTTSSLASLELQFWVRPLEGSTRAGHQAGQGRSSFIL